MSNDTLRALIHDTLRNEFRRVFGSVRGDNAEDGLFADGWLESFRYDPTKALPVLAGFDDGYGADDRGDAKVCRALEQAGALIK